MDVTRLTTAKAIGNMDVPRDRADAAGKVSIKKKAPSDPPPSGIDKKLVQAALDKVVKNTRFQYIIKDELNYFIVRIIDKKTDKVIREIPSKELQKIHEGIEQAIGILFDEVI